MQTTDWPAWITALSTSAVIVTSWIVMALRPLVRVDRRIRALENDSATIKRMLPVIAPKQHQGIIKATFPDSHIGVK